MYNEVKNLKKTELKKIDELILTSLEENPSNLNKYFEEFLFKGAKRLRPLFIFLVSDLLNISIDEDIFNLALCVELLHNASLIHDDILDDGEIRRNMPCIHLEYGNKTAVLAGDYLLSLGMKFASKIGNKTIENLSDAALKMTRGELLSLDARFKKLSLEFYIEGLKSKTSTLFLASLESIQDIKNIKIDDKIFEFAENFSLSFQIRDDILNYLKKDEGKISSDENEGIYTLPSILKSYGIIDGGIGFLEDLIKKTDELISEFPCSDGLSLLTRSLNVR